MNDVNQPVPFDPHRFETAAAHYLSGRPYYAPTLFGRVARLCGLTDTHRVLDLGCGPGQIAIGFAFLSGAVVAIDPEPEMLRIAASAAVAVPNIRFLQASSYDLGPAFGSFHLVTIGRAFHWMDRVATLKALDGMVEADGAIALFEEHRPKVPDNDWREPFEALVNRYAGDDAERARRKAAGWWRHEAVLLDSAFGRLERISVIDRRHTPVGNFVDRALSMSSTSRRRIGDKADALADEVRTLMNTVAHDGLVTEVIESAALIARRP